MPKFIRQMILPLTLPALMTIVLACAKTTGQMEPVKEPILPRCGFIYVGGCKYLWCGSASLAPVDYTCTPKDAVVSDLPNPVTACNRERSDSQNLLREFARITAMGAP